MASRLIDVMTYSSDPEEAAQELLGQLLVAVDRPGVHPTVRRQHEAGRVEVDDGSETVDRFLRPGEALRPTGDPCLAGVLTGDDANPELHLPGVRRDHVGGLPEHEAERYQQ